MPGLQLATLGRGPTRRPASQPPLEPCCFRSRRWNLACYTNYRVKKSLPFSYLVWALLGLSGMHRFYLRDYAWGVIYLITGGLFSIGWFVDAFTMPRQVERANHHIGRRARYHLAEARLVTRGQGYRYLAS